jgi:putative ABC transport system ATP-binding protein
MIKLSKVYKSFDKRVVLSDIALSVSNKEYVCITGESGAGKTTLLNLIGLLDKPDSGEISINGKTHFTSREILKLRRNFFGYIFQDYLLMNDKTVQENINISKNILKYENGKQDEKDITEIMERVRLDSTYLNKKVYQLSGGERQKVAIARMLLKPYELVLADEPTGNLDYKNKNEIIEIFKEIKRNGKTIICVTHDKDVADSADRVINLSRL